MGVGGQRHAPAALPPGVNRYPLYRSLSVPQGRSGQVLKISPPPGFDPRTLQLVASRYTDYANVECVNFNDSTLVHYLSVSRRDRTCGGLVHTWQ
jgi:hypothetical protein